MLSALIPTEVRHGRFKGRPFHIYDRTAARPLCVRHISLNVSLCAAILLLVAGESCADTNNSATTASGDQTSCLASMQDAFSNIAAAVEPTVVNIKAERMQSTDDNGDGSGDDQPDKSKGAPDQPQPDERHFEATGSGVIVRSDGYILTNDHVVDGADGGIVTVTLFDGRRFKGTVFTDARSDLAVVKIDPGSTLLPVATFADSSQVRPGQWAIAVGSPFDLENTMTVGVISALGRHQEIPGDDDTQGHYYPDLIQTDAAINPGNSGGPLFNIDGKIVGINSAIDSTVDSSAGIGFAIPSRVAEGVMEQLISHGIVKRGYLGVSPVDLSPDLQQEYSQPTGAFISDVRVSSPAWTAGLRASDIVTQFNGSAVTGEVSLRDIIAGTEPGTKVDIEYVRDGVPALTTATIAENPTESPVVPVKPAAPAAPVKPKLGIQIRDVTAADRQSMGLPSSTEGVYVVSVTPGGMADEATEENNFLLSGMVIQKIGKTTIRHTADMDAALQAAAGSSSISLVVIGERDGEVHQLVFSIPL